MKKIVKIICLVLLMTFNISGCGNSMAANNKYTEEELNAMSKVCGVVREIIDNELTIQICGSQFGGVAGKGYIYASNDYETFNINDSVIVYYVGEMKFDDGDEGFSVKNIEVCEIDKYDNDGVCKSYISVDNLADENGEEYCLDDPNHGVCYVLTPLDNEPEWQFAVVYRPAIDTIAVEVEDIWQEVTVKYDIETMEVISIIQ